MPSANIAPAAASRTPSPEFLAHFHAAAATQNSKNALRFDHFMRLALYAPEHGYYAQPHRPRVGRHPGTDFYTATRVGADTAANSGNAPSLFGELVIQSCLHLMGPAPCAQATFVEIGAEPGAGILQNLPHSPFAAARTLSLGQPLTLESTADRPLIVFSNELFDAQPCRRFIWHTNHANTDHAPLASAAPPGWHEIWVHYDAATNTLSETEHLLEHTPSFLPQNSPLPDGYRIDAPLAACTLLDEIARQPWHGLFLAFDYGKSWAELSTATPQGTARAYTHHRQTSDLLAGPGQQDLTCHVCWDWLTESLTQHHFDDIALDTQEAFFVTHAGEFIAQQIASEAHHLSPRKQALLQLLHPSHMGQKFQTLSALRQTS